jgi:hypothetical protein
MMSVSLHRAQQLKAALLADKAVEWLPYQAEFCGPLTARVMVGTLHAA